MMRRVLVLAALALAVPITALAHVTVLLPGGNSAYATSEYSLKAKAGERDIDAGGLETLVLVKGPDGAWKIRHAHTSSRPARRPPAV